MRACWLLEPQVAAGASPVDGPDGDPAEHELFGDLSSSDANAVSRPAASAAPPAPAPVRSGPGPGSGTAPQAARAPPPVIGWDSRIEEVIEIGRPRPSMSTSLPMPYFVSSSMGGICNLITGGVSLLRRTAPDFAAEPVAPLYNDTLVNLAANLPEPADRATAREENRAPPATPEPSPPVPDFRGNEIDPTLDVPSDYQSDWYEDWYSSGWTWNRSRDR